MKHYRLLSLVFLCGLLFSCSAEDELSETLQEKQQKTISLGFDLGGELNISESPMKQQLEKQGFSMGADDLFGIQVYRENGNPYAHVVGDDISKINMDFVDGETYDFKFTYVKEAKKIMYRWSDNSWGWPFENNANETDLNKVYYTSSDELDRINYVGMNTAAGSVAETYLEIDRYYGYIDGIVLNADTEKITLDLKRVVFSLNLDFGVAENLTEVDSLRFAINVNDSFNSVKEYFVPIENAKGSLEIPFLTIGDQYEKLETVISEGFQTNIDISIGTPENHIRFYDGSITIERMVRYNLEFTATDYQASSSMFDVNILEEEMTQKDLTLE